MRRRLRTAVNGLAGLALLVTGYGSQPAAVASEDPVSQVLFAAGTGGYHTYRIPSLIATPRGTVLAFCEGRKTSAADHGDVDLMLHRSVDGGTTWGQMQLLYEVGKDAAITIGNPCPVVDQQTGRIWLTFTQDNDRVMVLSSDDQGQSWSDPIDLTQQVKKSNWTWYATGPGVGIQLSGAAFPGRLMIPCDHRQEVGGRQVKFSHVFYSDDHGQSWQLGGSVAPHTDECQVVQIADGELLINMRNYWQREGGVERRGGMRAVATSRDGGASWSDLRFDSELIEPICQASLIRYAAVGERGDWLLFSNPASQTSRHRLTIRLSRDAGESWDAAKVLVPGPAAYSCLAVLPDGTIGCLLECGESHPYEEIALLRFSLDWLTGP